MPDQDQLPEDFTLRITRPQDNSVVLHVDGDLDLLSAPTLDGEITKVLADAPGTLILDLSEVPFFGSSALAVLIRAAESAEGRGVRLLLVASNRAVLRPLEVTRTADMFSIHDSVGDALGG